MKASPSAPALAFASLAGGLCLFVATAFAVVEPSAPNLDVHRLQPVEALPKAATLAARATLERSPAWISWNQAHRDWRVTWNERTGTAHRLVGPGLHTSASLTHSAAVESACRDLLNSASGLTGVRPSDLHLLAADHRLGRWYVVFEQTANGIPVRGGRADVRVTDQGDVLLLGADWHRNVTVPAHALVGADAALASASRDLGTTPTDVKHELVVVPEPQGAGYTYHLAHELHFRTTEPLGNWQAWVDAETGALLERVNQVRYADLTGTVTTQIEPITVGDPLVEQPLRDTRFNVGSGVTEFGYTGPDGSYNVTTAATDSVSVRVRLSGRFGRVFNQQLGLVTPAIDARMLPGSPRNFVWNDSNSRASERDAYYHALVAHQNIKTLDPAFTGLDYTMPIKVDIFDRECNAFYDGLGINFELESARCANTARIADVVLHEYGHGITDQVYRPLAPSGAMHEGFSDYWAATIMDDPRIGRGFRGPGTILRTVDNTRRVPDNVNGEVHNDGLIIAGALWDLRQALGKATADTLFHYARYGRADNFDDYLLDVLVTDDDNGNIYDGTPHFDAIVASFSVHGIGDYSVQIAHTPEADTEDLLKPLTIDATILSIFALDPASLLLYYRTDGGGWNELALAPAGAGVREFAATIPAQSGGTLVEYYVAAADTAGHIAVAPPAGSLEPFAFHVGTDITPPVITHTPLDDQPIDAPAGWTLLAEVTDNLDRAVAQVAAEYSVNSPALDQTANLAPAGLPRWAVGLPAAGASLGDVVHYRLVAVDSAITPNSADTPSKGDYTFQVVEGLSRDLEANDAGFSPGGEWEWGVPNGDLTAFTGTNVWGTGIHDSYGDNTDSALETALIDLGTWTHGAFVFHHWLKSEPLYDGGRVEITTDGGTSWTPIVPNGGYPVDYVDAIGGAGFNGDSGGWQQAEFDLSQFLGQTVALRWRFLSDNGVVQRGWFIDDVEIVARQVLSVPLVVTAESGLDSQVPVRWQAPAGIDPLAVRTPLTGYNVYRATLSDLSDAVLITPSPVATAAFTDADAVNGTVYFYAVTALYAAGESPPSAPAAGGPYVAGYSADVATLDVHAVEAASDTVVTFSNTGSGFLKMNVWLGDPADTNIDQVRIAYPLGTPGKATAAAAHLERPRFRFADMLQKPAATTAKLPRNVAKAAAVPAGGGSWTPLYTDTSEPTVTPDLKQFFVQETPTDILFKITAYQPWTDLLNDFNTLVGIDADANRETGDQNGNDYYIIVGPIALQFGVPAVILVGNNPVGVPAHQVLPAAGDSLEVSIGRALLGNSQRINLTVLALDPAFSLRDIMPNGRVTSSWLQPQQLAVSVPAGAPVALSLHFPGIVPFGNYGGKIFLETNAPANPVVTIPVGYHFATTPVTIADLSATQTNEDVVVRWRTTREDGVQAFRIFRAKDGSAFAALEPDVQPEPRHQYAFRDPAPEAGTYVYRIGEVGTDGRVTLAATTQVTVAATVPRVTFLDPAVPNPFNPTTILRFGLAVPGSAEVAIFDSRGRRLRTLWRTAHAEAAIYHVTWDGRDDGGRRVASGVYHARLVASGRAWTRRLTLVK